MNYKNFIISLIILINLNLFETTAVHKDCGSKFGQVLDVVVNDCKTTDKYCILKKNSNATIEITFNTTKPIEEVTAIVHGKFIGIYEPFPLPNPDGCYKSGLVCPLAEESTYTYEYSLPVLSTYPSLHGTVKWELQDENKWDIVCLLIPAKISS